jgi:hypothetical protein
MYIYIYHSILPITSPIRNYIYMLRFQQPQPSSSTIILGEIIGWVETIISIIAAYINQKDVKYYIIVNVVIVLFILIHIPEKFLLYWVPFTCFIIRVTFGWLNKYRNPPILLFILPLFPFSTNLYSDPPLPSNLALKKSVFANWIK